ncbi:hypothetical protein OG21DRAFT_1211014 [Imleria badia]|nr:hypothetical protein OG21DRAFT_1211014 [Imleria badia]
MSSVSRILVLVPSTRISNGSDLATNTDNALVRGTTDVVSPVPPHHGILYSKDDTTLCEISRRTHCGTFESSEFFFHACVLADGVCFE